MKRSLFVSELAHTDILDAAVWYELRRPGWADVFAAEVEATLRKLHQAPERFPIVAKSVRRAGVRRFPYGVFYACEPGRLVVIAVVHNSRGSKEWRKRISEHE